MALVISSQRPDYSKLACPKCGNAKSFVEFALTETEQRFDVDKGEPEFDASSPCDAPNYPQEIQCRECRVVVWEVKEEK